MPDDRLIFAPRPVRITFVIRGAPVETELSKWIDLPVKEGHMVHGLEDEMAALGPAGSWADTIAYLQRIVRCFCPALEQHDLEALSTRQLRDAITTAYAADPPGAVEGPGGASPSPSAASITSSPAPTAGAPPSSGR